MGGVNFQKPYNIIDELSITKNMRFQEETI